MNRTWPCLAGLILVLGVGAQAQNEPAAVPSAEEPTLTKPFESAGDIATNVFAVVRLLEAGIAESVVLAYIETVSTPFALTAEDLIYLNDVGVPTTLVTAMLHRDAILRDQQWQLGSTGTTNRFVYEQKLYGPTAKEETGLPTTETNQPTVVYVTNAPPDVTYFYGVMEPYGTWIVLDGLGWCWQPRIVVLNRFWRPYWDGGYWLYSDWGWYWYSDYSWGWAAFHYGRWHHHERHGWVWFPDRVWAPAWVCWRYSNHYCGWAPLPPAARFDMALGLRFHHAGVSAEFDFDLIPNRFNFVEWRYFNDRHPRLHGLSAERVTVIYRETRVFNRYVAGASGRIRNESFKDEHVRRATGRDIQPVRISQRHDVSPQSPTRDHLERREGRTILIHPEPRPPTRPPPIRAQRVDEGHSVIQSRPFRASPHAPTTSPRATPPPRSRTRTLPPQGTPTPPAERARPSHPTPQIQRSPAPPRRDAVVAPRMAPSRPRPSPAPRPPIRIESPKGRDQRISTGRSDGRTRRR